MKMIDANPSIPYHPSLLMAGIFHSYWPETMGKWIDDHPQPLPVDPMWSCIMFHKKSSHELYIKSLEVHPIRYPMLYHDFLKLHHVFKRQFRIHFETNIDKPSRGRSPSHPSKSGV